MTAQNVYRLSTSFFLLLFVASVLSVSVGCGPSNPRSTKSPDRSQKEETPGKTEDVKKEDTDQPTLVYYVIPG